MSDTTRLIIKAAKAGNEDAVRELLAQEPALIGARDTDGSTPLHYAAWKGHRELAVFLVGAGADVHAENVNDHWGTTSLHAAAHANQPVIVEALIAGGADVNVRDASGRTPLDHSDFHKAKAAARVLEGHGAVRGG